MAVTTTKTNKPINPRGNDQSPLAFNRAKLYSGKALDFDGVNDSINCGDFDGASFGNGTTDTPCSIVSYFYLDDADRARVLGKHTEWVFGTNNLNEFNFSILDGTGTSNQIRRAGISALPYVGKWVHMVATYDGSSSSSGINVYINGVLSNGLAEDVGSYVATQNTSANVYVGLWSVDSRYLNGKVSGTKIFNTALTAAQVSDLYNNPEKIVPTGVADSALKLWLPMMEGAGTTAYDGSGNGNHGTISGATWTHGIGSPVAQTAVIDWNKGQNLYAYSEQFDESSYWSYTQIHAVDSTGNEAPDGSLTADKLIANTNTAFHHIGKGVTGITIGISYRLSVWAKAGGHDYILINTAGGSSSGNAGPIVNLTNGSIAGSLNGEDYDATITDAGNGWYKIEYDFTSSGTTISIDYNQLPSASITAYAGDNTKGVYLWGASLRPTSSGSTYVRTGATAQTSDILLPQGLTTGRDITGVNLFENVRKQGALNLDGNSWAEVHDNASLDVTTGLTLEAWVYSSASDATAGDGVLSKWHEGSNERSYLMYALDFDSFYFFVSNDGTASNSVTFGINSADYEKYNHFVCTFDGTNLKAYVNGALYNTSAATFSSIYDSDKNVAIGNYNIGQTPERKYNNSIAQPRIYNRALTASEVLRNYNSGKSTYQ